MSKSQFKTPLSVISNISTHLLLIGDNKDGSQTLYSYLKSYDVKDKDLCDEVNYQVDSDVRLKISMAAQSKNWF